MYCATLIVLHFSYTMLFYRNGETFVDKHSGYATASAVAGFQKTTVRMYASGSLPSYKRVELPALSPTMESGTLISWEKKEGMKALCDWFSYIFKKLHHKICSARR